MVPMTRQGFEQLALFLLAGAAVFALLAWRARAGEGGARRRWISVGVLGGLAALSLVVGYTAAPNIPTPPVPVTARFLTNPVPDTKESWYAGRATYQKNCVVCHGPQAQGDGPAAFTLNPRPFNLQVHVPLHAPGETFYWISNGVAGTAMPPWKDTLSEPERWQLVRFLYALAAGRTS